MRSTWNYLSISNIDGQLYHIFPIFPIYFLLLKIINITHPCYTFRPSKEYFLVIFPMKSDMEISPWVNFVL